MYLDMIWFSRFVFFSLEKNAIHTHNYLYMCLLFLASIISLSISVVAWKRREIGPTASIVALFMLAAAWWAFFAGIHWSGIFAHYNTFWLNATYFGVVIIPTAFFVFAFYITDNGHKLTKQFFTIIVIEPVLTLLFLWTDKLHGLFFGGSQIVDKNAILSGGIWFWINLAYSNVLVFFAFVILLWSLRKYTGFRRTQIILILIGALIPWSSSIVSMVNFGLVSDLDLTPFAFTITGSVFAYALFRFNLLSILPVARDALVEIMTDGFFVVDIENRVVDINLAGQDILGLAKDAIGRNAEELFSNTPKLVELYRSVKEGEFEFFTDYYKERYLSMQVVPLYDNKIKFSGRLFIFRDITERKKAEVEIQTANNRLKEQLSKIKILQAELKKQAIKDPLTNLYNRRYLEEFLDNALAVADRNTSFISLLMVDIDHFKEFNDKYGHRAGDAVLCKLGKLMISRTRRGGDIACRYGGEEFVIVLTNTLQEDAFLRAEQFRAIFEKTKILSGKNELHATISIGVATYPVHGNTADEVLHEADNALYEAKEAGRNCVRKAKINDTVVVPNTI